MTRPLEVLLVTGPLGAGKTTVVNRLLKAGVGAGHRVAVLINEFGAVSVDGALVDAERPEVADLANLVNGCVCCSLREDVVATLATWCDQPEATRPQRVVLETTGLADPTDLLDLELEPTLAGRLRLAGCLTVVSALAPVDHLTRKELVKRQVGLASLVYVSKADLDPSLAMAWEAEIRARHPRTPLVQTRQGTPPPGAPDPWAGDLSPTTGGRGGGSLGFAEARSLTVAFDHPVDPAALEALFLRPWDAGCGGGELLRAKGVVVFAGWPPRHDGSDRWSFQVADGRLELGPLPLPPGGTPPPSVAVAIGTGLDPAAWRRALRDLERAPEGARRKVVLP